MPSPTTCIAYRWPDEVSGMIAWIVCFPGGNTVSGFERSHTEANTRIWIWCRSCGYSVFVLNQSHPNEVSHAQQ